MIKNDNYIKFFKALANEERIEIIKLLKKNGEMFAQDIEKHFYLEQSTTSHHLNMLKKAGITKSRKDGRKVFYSIDINSIKLILDSFDTIVF
ncbi:MAG: transcriptional regulator [Acidimicrobiaceae bacterium]|nr:transcriptional regulator [Actinomycetota bacterium]MBC85527.1 transcriptional regulator [Acidimicrobiaceae bacterium]|tara:strand:- start:1378 stop:1653 length:276 start_codon:yes stop_codon:yes gene_type:complete